MLRKCSLIIVFYLTLTCLLPLASLRVVHASPQTYYLSSSLGNDTNDGLSSEMAWKSLSKLSSLTFSAGDTILLKRGDTWVGEGLSLNGNGSSTNWITLSAYGTGDKPKITPYTSQAAIPEPDPTNVAANGILYAIKLQNAAGWKIVGLEIGFAKSGIVYLNTATGSRDGLWIEDCYIHDITKWPMTPYPSVDNRAAELQIMPYSVGIYTYRQSGERLQNVTVKNTTITRTDGPLEIRHADNVWIDALNATDSYREGVQLTGINYDYPGTPIGSMTNSVILRSGLNGMVWGTAGLQFNALHNFIVDNVEVGFTEAPNGVDGVGIDFEGLNKNVTVKNSFIHDNADEAVMIYRNPIWSGGVENSNTSLINNVFRNNGINNDGNPHAAFITQQYNLTNGGTISGNTIIKTNRNQSLNMIFEHSPQYNENWPSGGYTISDNIVKLPNGNIIHAASTGFSDTQGKNGWFYQQYDGSVFHGLTWNDTSLLWEGSAANLLIGDNWMHPANGYVTERNWIASESGNIRITGNPKKYDSALGNGVIASIWKNGVQLWSQTVATLSGVQHDFQVSVNAGDIIAFVLDSNGDSSYDKTYWNPVIEEIRQTVYTTSTDFSQQQGMYGWRYVQNDGSNEMNMSWNGSSGIWSGSVNNLLIGADWQHPAIGVQSQRKWLAPSSGTIRISGLVRKYDSDQGNGVVVSIWKNGVKLWGDNTITNLSGVSHDITTNVTAGDAVYFKVDANGDPSFDKTYWDPTIELTPSFNFDELMTPYWTGSTIRNESVLMLSSDGQQPEAPLLFHPSDVGSIIVQDAQLTTTYAQGVDWIYDSSTNKIKLTTGSAAPYMNKAELYPSAEPSGCFIVDKIGGGDVLGCEGHFFHDRQLVVSYKHEPNQWLGAVPAYQGMNMPVTTAKLKNGQPIKVTLYGDSISVGLNASGVVSAPPHLPNWGTLAMVKLQSNFASNLTFRNPSVGGKLSDWGAQNVNTLVSQEQPDLVIIAFGMNDGSGNIAPSAFKSNIQSIINDVRALNPNAEFILVAPTLANPETFFAGNQADYKEVLQQLTASGTVLMDMTSIHQTLLNNKRFQDMTGNNVNHPNDFLVRAYAQALASIMVP